MIKIRYYKNSDWGQLKEFISLNWRKNHPVLNKEFFDWQYKGFGNENKKINSIVLLNNNELIGFRGIIPGLYQVPVKGEGMKIVQGGALAMWMISHSFRGKKLGLQMHKAVEEMSSVLVVLGSEIATSAPIYQKSNWSDLAVMPRYILPLNHREYKLLINQQKTTTPTSKYENAEKLGNIITTPHFPNIDEMEKTWERVTFKHKIFSLYRNREFWKYRYLDHPVFKYLFFGGRSACGIIVARIEDIYLDEINKLEDIKILRIIEILPENDDPWKGGLDKGFVELLKGVLNWALDQGCIAADFYCSSTRFDLLMRKVGFRKQQNTIDYQNDLLPHYFQPLSYKLVPINVHTRIIDDNQLQKIEFESTYIVKSDDDADRPNIL